MYRRLFTAFAGLAVLALLSLAWTVHANKDPAAILHQGASDVGAVPTGYPMYVAGIDTSGNLRGILTSTGGQLAFAAAQTSVDGAANTAGCRLVNAAGVLNQLEVRNLLYNGSTWDLQRDANASPTTSTGVGLFANGTGALTSLNAVTTGSGSALDNGVARSNHTMVWTGSAGVSAGAVQLQGSLDSTSWVLLGSPQTVTASTSGAQAVNGQAYRYIRATVTTTITGGTVTCLIASAS
jgi:hypothetical protein